MTFSKQRILQMWEQEKIKMEYMLPLAADHNQCLTLGYQMMSRMKPLLYQAYIEDHPVENPFMVDVIFWMEDQGWNEMSQEFMALLDQSHVYNKAHRK